MRVTRLAAGRLGFLLLLTSGVSARDKLSSRGANQGSLEGHILLLQWRLFACQGKTMNALEALHQRVSVGKLVAPAPDQIQREAIFKAALRAADHGQLRPWRFLVIEGEGLLELGELFCSAALSDDPGLVPEVCDSYRKMPQRAPMIVVVIAHCIDHPKVPAQEQLLSAGAAAQNMLTAAYAVGVGAIWKTGAMAYHPHVSAGLGLQQGEVIIGFLYMGTPTSPMGAAVARPVNDFFANWPAQ